MQPSRARWAYAVLLGEVLVFYRHILFLGYGIPWDLRYYHLPLASIMARSFGHGAFPSVGHVHILRAAVLRDPPGPGILSAGLGCGAAV